MSHVLGALLLVYARTASGHEAAVPKAQHRLYAHLLHDYEPLVRPTANESWPVRVSLGLDLQQIVDIICAEIHGIRLDILTLGDARRGAARRGVSGSGRENEYEGYMETNSWLKFGWKDIYLVWDPAEFGGVSEVRLPANAIWRPDILMYNSANLAFDSTYPSNIIVYRFPFDDQKCTMKFGSWSYHGNQIDLSAGDISTATYTVSGEWSLMGVTGQRNVVKYACCPEPYFDVTFTIWIRRRTLYYHLNLVIPCLLVSSLALFGFALPPNSGERIVLGITVFMALCITMMQTTDAMPKLSDAVPLISVFFSAVNVVVILQVVLTVVVLNYFYRSPDGLDMPPYVRLVFLRYLPRLVLMEPRWPKEAKKGSRKSKSKVVAQIEGGGSRSLLANVLDMEGDQVSLKPGTGMYANVQDSGARSPRRPTTLDTSGGADCGRHGPPTWLTAILEEVRFMTGRMRAEAAAGERLADWVFAARVLDRFSLIVCTAALVLGITRVLVQAPHIIA